MSKTGRALIRSAVGQSVSMAVTLITGMVLLPFIVHHLGDRLYGAWALVSVALGYYGLLDLGLSSAVSRFVSRAFGQSDKQEADGIITTGLYLFSAAGFVSFIVTAIVALLCGRLIHEPAEAILFRNVFLVMGLSLGVSFPSRCYLGVLNAHLRYDLISIVDICSTLLRAALVVWVLLSGRKLLALAVAAAATNVVKGGVIIIVAQRIHGRTKLKMSLVTGRRIYTLFKYGFFTFLAQTSDLLRLNVYPFIISGFLGLAAVTPYAIAERLKGIIIKFSASALLTMAPVFSRQESQGDEKAIYWSYFFTYKISCYIGVFLSGMMAILGASFILRWMDDKYANVIVIFYVLLVGAFFGIIQIPTINFLYGTSRNHLYAITNIIEGVTNVILSIVLIRLYGLVGMAFGMAIAATLAKLIIQPFLVCRALNVSLLRYHYRYTLPNVARPAFFIFIVFVVTRFFLAPDYLRLSIAASAAFLFYLPYIMLVGFNAQERSLLTAAIRRPKSVRQEPEPEQSQG